MYSGLLRSLSLGVLRLAIGNHAGLIFGLIYPDAVQIQIWVRQNQGKRASKPVGTSPRKLFLKSWHFVVLVI